MCSNWGVNNEVENEVKNGLWMIIGDGQNTLFWEDLWVGDSYLKDRFPGSILYPLKEKLLLLSAGCGMGIHLYLIYR